MTLSKLTVETISRSVFVSDLHLFSSRNNTRYDAIQELSRYNSKDCLIVLGGDIFDFRWSCYGDLEQSLPHAETWLNQLLQRVDQSPVVYLLGNHDCHPTFTDRLRHLANEAINFHWEPYYFSFSDCLFLHGDIVDHGPLESDLITYRKKLHHDRRKHQLFHYAYDVAVALRLHRAIPRWRHTEQNTCSKLLRWMKQSLNSSSSNVRRIVFGHTHIPMANVQHQGIQFFNPGAALKHMEFTPVELKFHSAEP